VLRIHEFSSNAGKSIHRRVQGLLPLVIAFICGIVLLAKLMLVWFAPMPVLVKFTLDDGFYYFKIAANIADGKGSTFDGIHLTDGYHPLWAWMLVLVFRLTDDPFLRVRLALTFALLLGMIAAYLLYLILQPRFGTTVASLAAGLYGTSRAIFSDQITGQEFALFALLLCLTVLVYDKLMALPRRHLWHFAVLGGVIGLTTLSRLDAILILPAAIFVLWLDLRPHLRYWLVASSVVTITCGLVIAPYFAWKIPATGRLMTVSGRIKTWWGQQSLPKLFGVEHLKVGLKEAGITDAVESTLPVRTLFEPFLRRFPSKQRQALTLLIAYTIWLIALFGLRTIFLVNHYGLRLLIVYGGLHYIAYGFWLLGNYQGYQTPEFLLMTILTAVGLKAIYERFNPFVRRDILTQGAPVMVAVLVLYSGALCVRYIRYYTLPTAEHNSHTDLYWMARWMRSHLPPNTKVGAWNAGILGYFSDRCVVNLDGLVNSHEYFERYLKTNRVAQYLLRERINFLADYDLKALQSVSGKLNLERIYWRPGKDWVCFVFRLRQ
jgi:hypothetical protein